MARNCIGVLPAILLGWIALSGAAAQPPPPPTVPAQAPPETLVVGSMTLHRCAAAAAYCVGLERALDPSEGVPGFVSVHFGFYPHTNAGVAAGTLVATEGG